MAKPQSYEDKLRSNLKLYLVKIAANKADPTLTETEILKAFDLAVQKCKLTTLEHELVNIKPVEESKIDVSGWYTPERLRTAIDGLNSIACWEQEPVDNSSDGGTGDYRAFDEPSSARLAREVLAKIYGVLKLFSKP